MTDAKRKSIEKFVYDCFDILDTSGENTKYYKQLFSGMTNQQFMNFISKKLPFRFHLRQSVTEPTEDDIVKACDFVGVPLLEQIYLPYLFKDKDGNPIKTLKCVVGYQHIKKEQQMVTKKSKWAVDVDNRDMKSGRLIGKDKGAGTSDREFEGLVTFGLTNTMFEMARPRADSLKAKAAMNAAINTKGFVTQADIPTDPDDLLSRNYMNVYMLGALIETNLVLEDGYTPYTLKNKRKKVER